MTDNLGMIERDLEVAEIEERKALNLDLQTERDENLAEVDEKRRQIRMLNVARKKLELRSAEVRREIRTGKVFESRQGLLALDEPEARCGAGELLEPGELRHLIACVRPRELWPTVAQVETWHWQVRADVQRWCRVEHARANPIAGAPLPASFPMPNVLENVAFDREDRKAGKKRKAGKVRAAKPRPASGTPIRKGQGKHAPGATRGRAR